VTTPDESESPRLAESGARNGSFARDVLPSLLWTLLIFLLGGTPNPGPPIPLPYHLDKIQHLVAFAALQVLLLRALRYEFPLAFPRGMHWIAALVATAVGAALEVFQLTVPNRSAELNDFLANVVGASIAALVTARIGYRRHAIR
jgi:VanZ family protein